LLYRVARVIFAIQVMSSHPLLIRAVERILSRAKNPLLRTLPSTSNEAEVIREPGSPCLFVLDACSLRTDLGPLAARFRADSPGSKFLVLLSSEQHVTEEIRLFNWGIDGFVELHKKWQRELPLAIDSILKGQLWVPHHVLLAFAKRTKALLDAQLLHGHFLTAREVEVVQLLMRNLTNKEISGALAISERTVKFHVSNILSKLQIDNRHGLSSDKLAAQQLPDSKNSVHAGVNAEARRTP